VPLFKARSWVLLTLTVSFSLLQAQDVMIPEGWKSPVGSKFDLNWREDDPNHFYSCAIDLDGDEILDTALLLHNPEKRQYGLFFNLSTFEQKDMLQGVDVGNEEALYVLCLEVAGPGEYPTACGSGYRDCKEGEPEQIQVQYGAINYYDVEGGSSFFIVDDLVLKEFQMSE
jgi:hypothetical protein